MRTALVIVIGMSAAACSASAPAPRPLTSGFASGAGVADPYADGKRHLAAGRYELAVERFGQALAADRRSIEALNGLAIAHSGLGRFDVAQTHLERALQLDPDNAMTLNNYGWALFEQGRLREARPFLEQALARAAPSDAAVIAGNIDSIRGAHPPALVAALKLDDGQEADGHQLIRRDIGVHRLQATSTPHRPEPAASAHAVAPIAVEQVATRPDAGVGAVATADGAAPTAALASPERSQAAAEPRPRTAVTPRPDGMPIRLWPEQPPEPAITAGDKR